MGYIEGSPSAAVEEVVDLHRFQVGSSRELRLGTRRIIDICPQKDVSASVGHDPLLYLL